MAERREFLVNEDRLRGVRVVGWFEPGDPRLHLRVEQEIPDQFFTQLHEEAAVNTRHDRRKRNKVKVASVPHLLKQEWLKEINVTGGVLTDENPEVEKLMKRKLNDLDYRKLRAGGGRI